MSGMLPFSAWGLSEPGAVTSARLGNHPVMLGPPPPHAISGRLPGFSLTGIRREKGTKRRKYRTSLLPFRVMDSRRRPFRQTRAGNKCKINGLDNTIRKTPLYLGRHSRCTTRLQAESISGRRLIRNGFARRRKTIKIPLVFNNQLHKTLHQQNQLSLFVKFVLNLDKIINISVSKKLMKQTYFTFTPPRIFISLEFHSRNGIYESNWGAQWNANSNRLALSRCVVGRLSEYFATFSRHGRQRHGNLASH